MVPPAGTDSYNVSAKDGPMVNSNGMAMIRTTDHLPNAVFGKTLQDRPFISNSFRTSLRLLANHLPIGTHLCKIFSDPSAGNAGNGPHAEKERRG
jgi:hypothetical protein